jgi:hypothetical protein
MENIIERIAHFADIDTRRAMGFPPRKLPLSDLNLKIPKEQKSGHLFSVEFDSGIRLIFWPYNYLCYETKWVINENSTSLLFRKNGSIEISKNHWKVDSEKYIHPDFNEDGSLKRSRPC